MGYIIDNVKLLDVLTNYAKTLKTIHFFYFTNSFEIIFHNYNEVLINLDNEFICSAKLIIAADGINSYIRNRVNIPLIFKDIRYYRLSALVHTKKEHQCTFRCIVHDHGIIIFLPLQNLHLSYVFWILSSYEIKKYLNTKNMNQHIFNVELIRFYDVLGKTILCQDDEVIQVFPIRIQYACDIIKHRLILLGQSAYVACPFVFWNINIELMDVILLFNYLREGQKTNKDIGCYSYLQLYSNYRKHSRNKFIVHIAHILSNSCYDKGWIRYVLCAFDYLTKIIPNSDEYILKYIMGLNDVPNCLFRKK
ncbi:FAD-dependent monooxygenase [Candidatus Blochmanniella vafra]|uniref:FAD-dependent monooxygenase n=1 Tax=Candidatus Blochmanniella vafra TaxID=251535 RepID=UPI000300638B|nr:FAD-dependent monooxygenase [Candidatus Blochmannia vafer]